VSETFTLRKVLSDELVQAAEVYWKGKGLTTKNVRMPEQASGGNDPVSAEYVAEGGSIWTTNFDSYKKTVTVNFCSVAENTDVTVCVVLPGGLMSLQDRERAANLIESFYEALRDQNSR
jgi:hypothetical protein